MPITFINGFMCSGKTTEGLRRALATGSDFIDLDAYVEAQAGLSIAAIFEQQGESAFRVMERDALREVIHKYTHRDQSLVVACGGGTAFFYDNLERMKKSGVCIFLPTPPLDELCRRLLSKPEKRPLIAGIKPEALPAFIRELLKQRHQ